MPTRAQKIIAKRKKAAEEIKNQVAQRTRKEIPKDTLRETARKTTAKDSTQAVEVVETKKPGTPPDASANAGKMKQEPMIIEKVTLHFAFEFNSSDLDEPTEAFLDQLAETLRQDDNLQLNIEGHTDNIGSDKFNLKLSQKRAEVVKSKLIKKGIAAERLHAEGKGMHEPLNQNLTDEERAKNRRVEIMVYY